MAAGNSIRDEIKEQKKKFKDLTFSEKTQYIWIYYRYVILGVIIAAALIGYGIKSFVDNNYDNVCMIVVADGYIEDWDKDSDALTTGFTDYLGIDGKKQRIDFDYNYSLVPKDYDQDVDVSIQKIYTLSSTGSMDGYMTDKEYIDYFSSKREAFLYDLSELLSADEMNALSDHLVYYTTGEGNTIPFAVDLSDSKVIKDSGLTIKTPCYGIPVTAKNIDNAVAFIRYTYNL